MEITGFFVCDLLIGLEVQYEYLADSGSPAID